MTLQTYPPAAPVVAVESETTPVLAAGWTSAAEPLRFYRDPSGRVFLDGRVTGVAGGVSPLFTLPPGYRPAIAHVYPAMLQGAGASFFTVNADGTVVLPGAAQHNDTALHASWRMA